MSHPSAWELGEEIAHLIHGNNAADRPVDRSELIINRLIVWFSFNLYCIIRLLLKQIKEKVNEVLIDAMWPLTFDEYDLMIFMLQFNHLKRYI